ncbi:F-box protein [Trifolium pratense]|uniref:F-box protein n=1 Tax=Trifolium pratense TaxID=57577 RepID=A0A2K3NE86_TRIPR|nr:F-box protein [Trifolium pratense]
MVKTSPFMIGFSEDIISNLIAFKDVLFRIDILHALDRVIGAYVYKFDYSKREWGKVENVKDKVFFVSSLDMAFACQTVNREIEGGRIYIALKNLNYVYIYNIEDSSLVTSPPILHLPKNKSHSRWFVPDTFCRMTDTLKEEMGKFHQIRENESKSDLVYLKDAGDEAHNDSTLSLDVVEVIAKHLNDVLDYLQFRASNKLLRLAAPPIQWRSSSSMSMSRFDDLSMCPLFVFSEKDKVFTFLHPKHGLKYKTIIKFPQDNRWNLYSEICCSKDGWLLLVAVGTRKLGVIEATREQISWKVLEDLQAPCSTCFNNFLVECDGNLLSVFESHFPKRYYWITNFVCDVSP